MSVFLVKISDPNGYASVVDRPSFETIPALKAQVVQMNVQTDQGLMWSVFGTVWK